MKVRTIIVGCGWAGSIHADTISRNQVSELVGVVDKDRFRAESLANKYGIPFFISLEELFETDAEFDAAVVSTPVDVHFEACKALIEAGKAVFMEKPLVKEIEQAFAIKKMIEDNGVYFGINYNQRFASTIEKLKNSISKTEVFHLLKANMFQYVPKLNQGEVEKLFLITEACCHLVDTLRYVTNSEIRAVQALGASIEHDYFTDIVASLKFDNGSIGILTNTFEGGKLDSQHIFQEIEAITDCARYVAQNLYDQLIIYPHDSELSQIWQPSVFTRRDYNASMAESLDKWLIGYLENKPAPVTIVDGINNMLVVSAIIESLRANELVEIKYVLGG